MAVRQEAGKSQLLVINESPSWLRGCCSGAAGGSPPSANHSSDLPLPADLGPDLMKYTFLVHQRSLACHLPGGLCIHQIRTKAEWAFAFENPWCFIFFLRSLGISGERNVLWLKGSLFVKQCRARGTAQLLGHSPLSQLCGGRIGPAQ